jgi:hypothetical protein
VKVFSTKIKAQNKIQTRGPWATSLTWVTLAHGYGNIFPFHSLLSHLTQSEAMILTNLILYYVRKLSCKLSFSVFLILEKILLNDSTSFLHFCDDLPFEEDLALYFNKLEFPPSKDNS